MSRPVPSTTPTETTATISDIDIVVSAIKTTNVGNQPELSIPSTSHIDNTAISALTEIKNSTEGMYNTGRC